MNTLTDHKSDLVLVAEGRDGTHRAHRPTCKRAPADATDTIAYRAVSMYQAKAATCCKPILPEPETTPEPATFEEAVVAVLNGADPIAVADALAGGTPEELNAETDRAARLAVAKTEAAAMKAWRKSGAKGTPPATPNLDALNAETASTPRKANGAKGKVATPAERKTPEQHPRYVEARAAEAAFRAGGARKAGVKVTDEQVTEAIAALPEDNAGRTGELIVARWISGWSMERARWNRLWMQVRPEG